MTSTRSRMRASASWIPIPRSRRTSSSASRTRLRRRTDRAAVRQPIHTRSSKSRARSSPTQTWRASWGISPAARIDRTQWNDFVRKSQDSLRVLAEETGGIAVVNQNDFSKALKRIDAETSDYYVLGYYSKNTDIMKRRRKIEVRVTRTGQKWQIWARKEYVLKAPPAVTSNK